MKHFFLFLLTSNLRRLYNGVRTERGRELLFFEGFEYRKKVVPNQLLQLYTINVLIETASFASGYILMQNKTQNTYFRAFQALNNHIQIAPQTLMLDFEIGARNAFLQAFDPHLTIRHCIFHMGQSIIRRVQTDGFIQLYTNNEDYRKLVRSLTALSFLRVEQVIPAFNLLRARMNLLQFQNNADSILDYFGRTYVIRPNGADPLFVPTSWNHHDSIIGNLARTNNAQEAFHLALRRQFAKEHPPLSRLINVLKSEERIATDRLREYEVDNTRGINLRPRAKKYRENDAAIKRMVMVFDEIEEPTDQQYLDHLRALQYRLAGNVIDNWGQ